MAARLPARSRDDQFLRCSYVLAHHFHFLPVLSAPRRPLLEGLSLSWSPSPTLRQLLLDLLAHQVCFKICELAVKFLIALLIFKEHPECQTKIIYPVAAEGQL